MRDVRRLIVLSAFAAAMAWVEAAVVVYLRVLVARVEPYQPNPLPASSSSLWLGGIELVREAATLVMLWAAGWLAGHTARSRWGYAVMAFGIWDLSYYLFLKLAIGWPHTLLDWDILFLLPVPWWGPVLAPAAVALLMAAGGGLVGLLDSPARPVWPSRRGWALGVLGVALVLYAFMGDGLAELGQGLGVVREMLPLAFKWPVFLVGLALLAAPLASAARRVAGLQPVRA